MRLNHTASSYLIIIIIIITSRGTQPCLGPLEKGISIVKEGEFELLWNSSETALNCSKTLNLNWAKTALKLL